MYLVSLEISKPDGGTQSLDGLGFRPDVVEAGLVLLVVAVEIVDVVGGAIL